MWSRVLLLQAAVALVNVAATQGVTKSINRRGFASTDDIQSINRRGFASTDNQQSINGRGLASTDDQQSINRRGFAGVARVVDGSDDASPGHRFHLLETTTFYDFIPALSEGEVVAGKRRVTRALRPARKIKLSEADGSVEGTVVFQLGKKAETEVFKITDESPWVTVESNGAVRLKRPLDYEEMGPEKEIDFRVTITNAGLRRTDRQRIIIHVKDVNDEPPYFINLPMQAVVPLNATPNTTVFKLQARDADTDHDIHYFIVRDSSGGRFQVDETSGEVRTSGTDPFLLDMEYVLYVKAEDRKGPVDDGSFQSTPEERLSIAGGMRAPQFSMPSYDAEIPENQEGGSDIISVRAKSLANLGIRYALKGQGAETFRIGPDSGTVILEKELDFEDFRQPRVYSLIVTATEDFGGFSADAELTVTVTDVNDNAPKFKLPDYEAHNVDEDIPIGTSVLRVHATDADSGANAEIEYSVSDNRFIADADGVISNNRQLDADNNDTYYEFVVTAVDKGEPAKTGTATVRIHTNNKNDEAPKFSQQVYTSHVDDNAGPNTLVATIVASDEDGDNVRYGFSEGDTSGGPGTSTTGQFVIDEVSGVIRLHGQATFLDRDKYELNVTATDDGSCCPGGDATLHTSAAVVVVFITDVNDNKPIFYECETYHPKVKEGAPIGSPVIKVHATDEDVGNNGIVKYSIVQGPSQEETKFTVEEETGIVFTNKVFDREGDHGRLVPITVKATDHGEPFLEGVCSFTVEITDINDNSTVIDRQENYTSTEKYLKNVNRTPPVFEKVTYIVQIVEEDDRRLPRKILQVKAVSVDTDMLYFLAGEGIDPDNPAKSKFDINRTTGEIFVLRPLDRDLPWGQPQWKLMVFAMDYGGEGLVGYADVIVNVKDVNDNSPYFPDKVYFGTVNENGTAGMFVMTMTAVDYDDPNQGTNAKITYSIKNNAIDEERGMPIFEIEPETGIIKTVVCCLDRERTPDYSIQVVGLDGGGLKGTGTASIRVKDINDMPPRFAKEEWFTEVDETTGSNLPETPILTVTVHDEDETNKFQYKVVENSGYGADKFTMVSNNDGTGSLKIVQPLDYEDKLQSYGFRFRIQVNDKGDNNDEDKYHIAYSWVVVKLRDINDNKPQFERSNIEVSVDENAEVGKSLETFKATDPDQGGKSRVSYAIDRTSDRRQQFTINNEGTVSIQRSLDREDTPKHHVIVLAIDDGIPPMTATATLTVIVQDINDNAPMFLKDYRPVLPEHASPRKVVELLATDADDASKSNGPPFTFHMDPKADSLIQDSFKVEHDPNGAIGEGMAVVSSLRSFDREQQKEYFIPIVIKDSGNPAMSGTSTLTVVIGDINDHKMQPGTKDILVHNYRGQSPDAEIGQVYVSDLDDWDLPDKTFYWDGPEDPHFQLNKDTGMITMRHGTRDGQYNLCFRVNDRKHTQDNVTANVSVTVRKIPHNAVLNSGSVRLSGITDEDFIRVWNYGTQSPMKSKAERFRKKVADLFKRDINKVDVFSIQLKRRHPPITDVRFSVKGLQYYDQVLLNGRILMHRSEIEKEVGINITMVGIDECLEENGACEGSCTNSIEVSTLPYMVDTNRTSLVGVRVDVLPECMCGARNFSRGESCSSTQCLNGGSCMEGQYGLTCICPNNFGGPRCQQTTRHFKGSGWAWYSPLEMCEKSHLSLEFITSKANGTLLYNGPIVAHKPEEVMVSDFISVELENGRPRVLVDFGSGTLELHVRTKKGLDDGEWHRIDIFWDTENVRAVVDFCKSANVSELKDGTPPEFDGSTCQAEGAIPSFAKYLNVNAPLQLGGLYVESGLDLASFRWQSMPLGKPFNGCIRNVVHNSKLYDLGYPGFSRHSESGCPPMEEKCHGSIDGGDISAEGGINKHSIESGRAGRSCGDHGTCVGSFGEGRCECQAGWTGPHCSTESIPTTFKEQSYIKYALSFEPDRFATSIQMRFRTREASGELFRVSDRRNTKYGILEIRDSRLHFRYNLNSVRNEEKDLWLSEVNVIDGQWHTAKVSRYGSAAILELDRGEGRRYNETFKFEGHQWLLIDKQEGVYAGGKAEYTGVKTFEFNADYQYGCIDDIRLDGKQLPMPPVMKATQWGQTTMSHNVDSNCPSNEPCAYIVCPQPFECVDLWNDYECICGAGRVKSANGRDCVTQDECVDPPCPIGGV